MAPAKSFRVAIVGGGIAGITLAIALHSRGIPVDIYEQAHAFGEIGAGVSIGPNAVQAMKYCHEGIYEAFEKVCTRNLWPAKQKVWFDYYDGYNSKKSQADRTGYAFTISNDLGHNGVYRASFLDEMIDLIPKDIAHFNKQLEDIGEKPDGKLEMRFGDGTSAEADVVIGCDGIKSRVRQVILGKDYPHPSYTYKYAYRGLVPMDIATQAIGEEKAQNSCMHMGPGGHVLTFPVNHGNTLNIVAFHNTTDEWADYPRLTRMGTREEALRDFANYGHDVIELLKLVEPELSVWAIYDLGEHPVPTFAKDRIAISGDAAHATSPHHGAGAGFCLEDTAVLLALLEDERVHSHHRLQVALAAFDFSRRERSQWLVESSRFIGDCYEWRAPGVGDDFQKIEEEINRRTGFIYNVDIQEMCEEAKEVLGRMLSAEKSVRSSQL